MSSSLTAVPVSVAVPAHADVSSYPGLLSVLASVPDPRARRGVRHAFAAVLAVSVAAVVAEPAPTR